MSRTFEFSMCISRVASLYSTQLFLFQIISSTARAHKLGYYNYNIIICLRYNRRVCVCVLVVFPFFSLCLRVMYTRWREFMRTQKFIKDACARSSLAKWQHAIMEYKMCLKCAHTGEKS